MHSDILRHIWGGSRAFSLQPRSVCVCVCVCVTPNHFRNLKAFAIIHHLSTAMSALQQCLVVRLPRPLLPLGTTRRLYTVFLCPLPRPVCVCARACASAYLDLANAAVCRSVCVTNPST